MMGLNKRGAILCLVMCMAVTSIPLKPSANDDFFYNFTNAITAAIDAIKSWNEAIDKITDIETRKQLQRRMYRLSKQMRQVIQNKQELKESILAGPPKTDNIDIDLDDLHKSVKDLGHTLGRISELLHKQDSFDGQKFENQVEMDLNAKVSYILKMKSVNSQNIERQKENRDKLIQELDAALGNLKKAREVVVKYLRELQKE